MAAFRDAATSTNALTADTARGRSCVLARQFSRVNTSSALAGHLGGASKMRGAVRVALWGAAAMAATSLVGKLFGAVV